MSPTDKKLARAALNLLDATNGHQKLDLELARYLGAAVINWQALAAAPTVGVQPTPSAVDARRLAIEAAAKVIYESWSGHLGYKPWQNGGNSTKQDAAPVAVEARSFTGFLCRAWGETDLPCAEVVADLAGVRRFMVREWLGSEDSAGADGSLILPSVMDEIENGSFTQDGSWSAEFEIGGVSVDRVYSFAAAPTVGVQPTPSAVEVLLAATPAGSAVSGGRVES